VPPPAAKTPTLALYLVSVLTSLLLIYLFILHPCCCGRRPKQDAPGPGLPGGLVVLPVGQIPGQGGKKGKKNKKNKDGGEGVQVNLIVDPGLLGGGGGGEHDDHGHGDGGERDSDGYTLPSGGWSSTNSNSGRGQERRPRPRRSIFEALAQENRWRAARRSLKQMTVVDVCGIVVWGVLFVFILMGKRCPAGQYEGWCVSPMFTF
jgi:hypothetical protein